LKRIDPSPVYTTALDRAGRRQFNWRSDLRQYEIMEWPPEVRPSDSPSGPVITVERKTTDTGDRKQVFGRTARHLVSRVIRSDSPETVIDAWYIDVPGFPTSELGVGGSLAMITVSASGQTPAPPRIEFKQTGPTPEGLAVWQKMTTELPSPGSSSRRFESISETVELVEGALPDNLFQPPDGYQRVVNLPYPAASAAPQTWGEAVRARWQRIENWFSSVF
jgi:hypothetical protein